MSNVSPASWATSLRFDWTSHDDRTIAVLSRLWFRWRPLTHQAARNKGRSNVTAANKLFRQELVGGRPSESRFSPFAVAAFSENPIIVDKVEEAYKQGGRESPGGGEESGDLIQASDVITHVKAVISMREEARAKPKSIGAGAAEETDLKPAPAPEVTMLLRNCRGTGALRGLLEVMKDKGFRQSVESAELQYSMSKAKEAVEDGSFEGLRSERCVVGIAAVGSSPFLLDLSRCLPTLMTTSRAENKQRAKSLKGLTENVLTITILPLDCLAFLHCGRLQSFG